MGRTQTRREARSILPLEIAMFPGKGRGVRTSGPIPEGAIIEQAPVILLGAADLPLIERTSLFNYYFYWGGDPDGGDRGAVALGLISLCNHSPAPNCGTVRDIDGQRLELIALRPIEGGEELTIDYGCPLWFQVLP